MNITSKAAVLGNQDCRFFYIKIQGGRLLKHRIIRSIRTPEDLGIAHLGNPNTAIVPPKHRIDRAEYGRRLAEAEGGIFTPSGYYVPIKKKGRKTNAA